MSSYLDISIERQLEDRSWVNLLNCSYSEERKTVDLYKLRDVFRDCDCYESLATKENISEESLNNFAVKIQRNSCFNSIQKGSKLWPYDKKPIETLINAANVLIELEHLANTNRLKFSDTIVYLKDEKLEYDTPYAALQDLKYNSKYAGVSFNNKTIGIKNYCDTDGNSIDQFRLPENIYISSYKNLKALEQKLADEIEQMKQTQNDESRLGQLLAEEISELDPKDMNGPLGDIVKRIINNNDAESDFYTKEYIDSLEGSLDELKFLIHLVGENGRIIWGIS